MWYFVSAFELCFRVIAVQMEIQTFTLHQSSPGSRDPRLKYRVDLPVEIITEILARIPANDLLRFKTVCKSWYSLILSPHFVKSHLAYARQQHEIIFEVFTRKTCVDLDDRWDLKYISMKLQDQTIQPELSLALDALDFEERKNEGLVLRGSCDGLLIFEKPLSVYNPVTRKSMDLPSLPQLPRFDGPGITLAYDGSIHKYKVFAIDCSEGFFFTLGRDILWRELAESLLPGCPNIIGHLSSNFLFVGCELHWVMKVFALLDDETEVEMDMQIFSMDIREEKYEKTGLPIRKATLRGREDIYLSELKGTVCLTNIFHDELKVRMLEKNGSTCQWTTLYDIKLHALPDKPDVLRSFLSEDYAINAFCVPSSNSDNVLDLVKVFIQHDGMLLFYDLKTNVLQQIQSVSSERRCWYPYVFHANSLVSW